MDLVGKTITITEGPGAGASAIISGYDDRNNIFTVTDMEDGWDVEANSKFVVTYNIEDEFVNYFA